MVVLMREEGLVLPQLGEAYMSIARIFRRRSDERSCVLMAVRGIEAMATIFGKESKTVVEAKDWLYKKA
jgi:hypothetical protein